MAMKFRKLKEESDVAEPFDAQEAARVFSAATPASPKLQQAAPPGADTPQSPELAAAPTPPPPKPVSIIPGKYVFEVHVIEGRDLWPRDINGMSDPYVEVTMFDTTKKTEKKNRTLNALWDSHLSFEIDVLDRMQLEQGRITFLVKDYDLLTRDDPIGLTHIDLIDIVDSENHSIYKQWFPVLDFPPRPKGVQGYILVSVFILGPGIDHVIPAELPPVNPTLPDGTTDPNAAAGTKEARKGKLEPKDKKGDPTKSPARRASVSEVIKGTRPEQKVIPTTEKVALRRSSSAESRKADVVDVPQKPPSTKGTQKETKESRENKASAERAGSDTRGRAGPKANLINMYVSRPPKFDISLKEIDVEIIAAQGLPRMDRFAMKGNAATDAFVRVELGGYKLETEVITSYNPQWNTHTTLPFQVCREREPEELVPRKKPLPLDRMDKARCQSLTKVKPSHRLRISVLDKDPLSSEAIATLRPIDIDVETLDSAFFDTPRWFYLYGAPATQDNSEASAMNKGYLPGSAYRGRIKLRIQLRDKAHLPEHDFPMPQFKRIEQELVQSDFDSSFKTMVVKSPPPRTLHGWIWDGCFLEGSKSMRLEIGFGQYQILVKPKAAQQVEGLPGQFRWYKEFLIEFTPEDDNDDELPDLIVAVSPGTSKNRIGYLRFPGADLVPFRQPDTSYQSGKDRYLRRTLEIPKPFESGWQPLIPDVSSGWDDVNRVPGFIYCRFTLTDGRRSPDEEFNKLPIQIAALRSKDQQREEDIIWAVNPPAPPGPPPLKGEKPRPIGLHGVIGFLSNYVRYNLRIGVYMGRNLSGDDPGTADAVCAIEVMGKTLKTEVQKESLNPVWDMYFNTINDIKLLDGDTQSKIIWPMMCIKVYDKDPSHFVGFHYLPLSEIPLMADGKEPELRMVDTNMNNNAKWKLLPMTDDEKRAGSPQWPCFCLGLYAQLPGKLLSRVPGSVFVYMYLLPNNQKDASDWSRRLKTLAPSDDKARPRFDDITAVDEEGEDSETTSSSEEEQDKRLAAPKRPDTKQELSSKSSMVPAAHKQKDEQAHMFLRLTKMMPLLGRMKTVAIDMLGLRLLPGSSYVADTLSKGVYVVEFQFVGFSASTKLSWPTEAFIKETEKRNEERKRLEALEAEEAGGFEALKKKLNVLPNLATESMDAPNFKEIKLLPFLYLEAFKPYAPVLTVRIYKTSSGAGINMPTLIGIAGFEIPPQCIDEADAMATKDEEQDEGLAASTPSLAVETEKKKGGLFGAFKVGEKGGLPVPGSSSSSRDSQVKHIVDHLSSWVEDRIPLRGEPGGVSWSKFARLPPEKLPEPPAQLDPIAEEPSEPGAMPRTPSAMPLTPSPRRGTLTPATGSGMPSFAGKASPLIQPLSASPSLYGMAGGDPDELFLAPPVRTRKRRTSVLAEDFKSEGYEPLKDAKEIIEVAGKREETDDIPFNSEDVLRGTKTGATQTAMLGAMKVPLVFKRSKETDANYLVGKIRSCMTVLPSIKPSYYEDALKDDKIKSAFASWERNRVVVRVYILRAINLPGMDLNGKCDPYLVFLLGNNVDNRKEQKKTADRYPVFNEVFTKTIELPGSAFLTIQLKDFDVIGADEMIGETLIDIESRWYSRKWHQLMWKNIADENARTEWRTLRNPKRPATPAGKIQMRIELFDLEYASHVPEKPLITARLPFEIRVCVWDARNLMHMDPIRGCNDLFVVAILDGMTLKEDNQESDTHIGAREGKGSINWRFVFKLELPCDQVMLKLQAYDRDILKVDSIGEAVLDLTEMCRKSFEARTSGSKRLSDGPVTIKTQYVPLYHPEPGRGEFPKKKKTLKEFCACTGKKNPKEPTVKGELKVDLMILPMDLAERLPAGKGREAPNRNPILPEPDRIKLKWNRPDLLIKEMLGPELFRKVVIFCCLGTCVIGGAIICIWIFSDTISTVIANLIS